MKIKNKGHDYEYYQIVEDLLNEDLVRELDEYTHHHFQSRLDHSISVSYYGYRVGKKLGLDYVSMARAGLLHDLFHYNTKNMDIDGVSHNYIHPRIALKNAKSITDVSPLEEDIIVNHMAGATLDVPKSKEAWAITAIDKYLAVSEVSRGFLFNKVFNNKNPYKLAFDLDKIEFNVDVIRDMMENDDN